MINQQPIPLISDFVSSRIIVFFPIRIDDRLVNRFRIINQTMILSGTATNFVRITIHPVPLQPGVVSWAPHERAGKAAVKNSIASP